MDVTSINDRREFGGQLSARGRLKTASMRLFPGACRARRKEITLRVARPICDLSVNVPRCGSVLKIFPNQLKLPGQGLVCCGPRCAARLNGTRKTHEAA